MDFTARSAINVLLDLSPGEWIAGLIVSFILSLGFIGIYFIIQKNIKINNMHVLILSLVFNFIAMAIAMGYSGLVSHQKEVKRIAQKTDESISPDRVADSVIDGMAMRILIGADADHNGSLSATEAAAASERFVRTIEGESNRTVNHALLGDALKRRIKPPGVHSGLPAGAPAVPR